MRLINHLMIITEHHIVTKLVAPKNYYTFDQGLMDIPLSDNSFDALRKHYEERTKQIKNKKTFQSYMNKYMPDVLKKIGFDIDVEDDEDKRITFCEVLRNRCIK